MACVAVSNDATPFPLHVIDLLKQLVGANRAGYVESQPDSLPNIHAVESPWIDVEHLIASANEALWSWPLRDHLGRKSVAARSLSESLTRQRRRHNLFHNVFSVPLDVEDELKIWLPAPQRQARNFWFCRSKHHRDFGERERDLARLLAPHLAAHRERWQQRQNPDPLTEREAEVLRLVTRGLTNREIAAELVISTGTVRKHLDNIYAKLDVHTRTSAAAAIHQHRPSPLLGPRGSDW